MTGNYWGTAYTGADANGDGIGDTSYVVPGGLGSDTAPLMGAWSNGVITYTPPSVTPPVAAFTGTPTSGTEPLTITFTDASTNTPTSWAWDFGDGSSTNATQQNPVHTYAAAGTYNVTLTATNSAGSNTATQTGYVTVNPAVITLPGQSAQPTDPDHDGLYEDLNGNGRKDYNDLQVFYSYLAWVAENEPLAPFDFNGNGRIDFNDLQVLYTEMV